MTILIKAHTGDPSKPITGEMTDLGLCYVSRFVIDGETYDSVSPQSDNIHQRMANDRAYLARYGYFDMEAKL